MAGVAGTQTTDLTHSAHRAQRTHFPRCHEELSPPPDSDGVVPLASPESPLRPLVQGGPPTP